MAFSSMIGLFRRRGDRYQCEVFLSFSSLHTPIILTCVPSVFFGLITYSQFTPGRAQRFPKMILSLYTGRAITWAGLQRPATATPFAQIDLPKEPFLTSRTALASATTENLNKIEYRALSLLRPPFHLPLSFLFASVAHFACGDNKPQRSNIAL